MKKGNYQYKERWVSTRFDIEGMHWSEVAALDIPELGMNWGQCCSALKKSWAQFSIALKENDTDKIDILKSRINNIQENLGIEVTEWYM